MVYISSTAGIAYTVSNQKEMKIGGGNSGSHDDPKYSSELQSVINAINSNLFYYRPAHEMKSLEEAIQVMKEQEKRGSKVLSYLGVNTNGQQVASNTEGAMTIRTYAEYKAAQTVTHPELDFGTKRQDYLTATQKVIETVPRSNKEHLAYLAKNAVKTIGQIFCHKEAIVEAPSVGAKPRIRDRIPGG